MNLMMTKPPPKTVIDMHTKNQEGIQTGKEDRNKNLQI